jgi:hypothetical protein
MNENEDFEFVDEPLNLDEVSPEVRAQLLGALNTPQNWVVLDVAAFLAGPNTGENPDLGKPTER